MLPDGIRNASTRTSKKEPDDECHDDRLVQSQIRHEGPGVFAVRRSHEETSSIQWRSRQLLNIYHPRPAP